MTTRSTGLTGNHGMVSLVRLQRDLLDGFEVVFSQRLDLAGEYLGRRGNRVDTTRFDRNHGMTTVFEEVMSVHSNDTSLIRLSDIGKYHIYC